MDQLFERQIRVQPATGKPGQAFAVTATLSAEGYLPTSSELVMGFANQGTELTVLVPDGERPVVDTLQSERMLPSPQSPNQTAPLDGEHSHTLYLPPISLGSTAAVAEEGPRALRAHLADERAGPQRGPFQHRPGSHRARRRPPPGRGRRQRCPIRAVDAGKDAPV